MSRRTAREKALQLVYGFLVTGDRNDFGESVLCEGMAPDDEAFAEKIYDGVLSHFFELQNIIAEYSKGFSVERIYKTDLAALLIATYEILYAEDVPVKVAVNEALELSKTYSTDKSAGFVNGILASVIAHREELIHADDNH